MVVENFRITVFFFNLEYLYDTISLNHFFLYNIVYSSAAFQRHRDDNGGDGKLLQNEPVSKSQFISCDKKW